MMAKRAANVDGRTDGRKDAWLPFFSYSTSSADLRSAELKIGMYT